MRWLLICLICMSFLSCHSQGDRDLLSNWKSSSITTNEDTLRKYNYSTKEWRVFLQDNVIHVALSTSEDPSVIPFKIEHGGKTDLSAIQVNYGFLVGFNSGEWGGHLDWFSTDGKRHYKISDDIIVQFQKLGETIFSIQGLAHMGRSEGSIAAIQQKGSKWVTKLFLELPFAPYAATVDVEGNFIIITSDNLLKVDKSKKIITLVENGMWSNGLYPNSLVIKDGVIYAGMRAGVFKYNLKTKQQEWLMPN